MNTVLTLGELAIRAYKNPCDISKISVFGIGHPFCYYMQFLNVFNQDVNISKCQCNIFETCKAPSGRCSLFPSENYHILCDRPLCDICKHFREYYFLCFKLLFEEEPLKFEKHLKFNKYKFNIYLKQVIKYKHCIHNEEFQNHEQGERFPEFFMLFYESNVSLKKEQKEKIYELAKMQISKEEPNEEQKIEEIFKNLKAAYEIIVSNSIKYEKIFLRNEDLILLNDTLTNSSNWQLRQLQQYHVDEEGKKIWKMDTRIIKYYLNILNDMFNERKISHIEYREKFIRIWAFEEGNEILLDILFLEQ